MAEVAVVAELEGLLVVTFVAGCFELEVLVAGRAVVVVVGLVAVVGLLVVEVEVEVAGRAVVLLVDEAGRLVADEFVVGRLVAALLC